MLSASPNLSQASKTPYPFSSLSSLSNEEDSRSTWVRWRKWIILLALAVLVHALALSLRSFFLWKPLPPPPVELTPIDPAALDRIKDQWKDPKQKALLLNRDPSLPKEKETPKDARFFSDRNTKVDREEQARVTDVVPKTQRQQSQPNSSDQNQTLNEKQRPLPSLDKLGLRYKPTERQIQQPPGSSDSAQALRDPRAPLGNQNLLNTQESIYYAFYARMYEAIGPVWQGKIRTISYRRRVSPGDYTTVVDVVLDREGNFVGLHKIQSSSISEFDEAVEETLRKVARFSNPPKGLLDAQGFVHTGWTFTVNVGSGFNFDYLPPERAY